MDGHDAPISLSPTSIPRAEEGLQHHPEVRPTDSQQAPSPFPENDDVRRQSIPWETHPRRPSITRESRQGSMVQEMDSRRGSENSTIHSFPPPLRRQTTNTMSVLSENIPQDPISPFPVDHQELDSHATQNSTEILQSSEVPSEKAHSRWEKPYLRWANPRHKRWRHILPLLTLTLLGILIAIIILYTHAKKISTSPDLIITITTQSLALPTPDSALTATPLIYSTLLSSSSTGPSTLLAYMTSNGSICIRTYLNTWLTPIQCITNLSPKPHTPLALLDWYGGPSIYYVTTSNHIHGIDNIPQNNTWAHSSINIQTPPVSVHPESQLTAVTWLNGSSAWLYFQDQNSQLREYGIDDYRDTAWRDGALGPLGIALEGTGIGASRYLLNGSEVLEVFIQTDNDAIHGRVFMDDVWEANFYSVDYTDSGLPPNAALAATTIEPGTGTGEERVMLVWVNSSGFVNVQGRGTVNVSAYNSFSGPTGLWRVMVGCSRAWRLRGGVGRGFGLGMGLRFWTWMILGVGAMWEAIGRVLMLLLFDDRS